jgi:hypothetical protein
MDSHENENIRTLSGTAVCQQQEDTGAPLSTDVNGELLGKKLWEQVEGSTLQLIANLFPAPTLGQIFVTRFVERAATKRSIVPDLNVGDVVITTKSIATLAAELGLAYDTVQKYVVLFQALGLLQKHSFMGGQIAFILALGIYLPPRTLKANLDYLLQRSTAKKSRTKFHDQVQDVKERCMIYGLISQEFIDALRQLHTLVQPPEKGQSRRALELRLDQAQHLVSSMIAQAMTGRLTRGGALLPQNLPEQPGLTDDDTRQHEEGKVPPPNLPDAASRTDAEPQEQQSESTQTGESGRCTVQSAVPNLPSLVGQIDSGQHHHSSESTQSATPDRFVERGVVPNLPNSLTQVDSVPRDHDRESTQSANPGRRDASSDARNLPASEALVDSLSLANVNVGNIITRNINVNVETVAAFLCRLFNEPTSKKGIYSRLLRNGCNQAEVIHAAALFALIHFHQDKTITNPAAVFIARCKAYHAQGVPEEAAILVKQYGTLSYQQLLDALQKPTVPSKQGPSFPASPSHPATPTSLPPLPQWGTIPRLTEVSHSRTGMSRQEALQVVARARGDRRTKMCCVDLERLSDDRYAVLLDNTITAIPRQAYFYSLHEWEMRTATITDCFELFGVTSTRRRCLADALQERKTR